MANEIQVDIVARLDKIEKQLGDFSKKAEKSGKEIGDSVVGGFEDVLKNLKSITASSESLGDILHIVKSLGISVGVLGAALYGVKKAFDLTLEGEQLKAIENQFNTLTSRAGVNGKELLHAFEDASAGLVSTNNLMASANKALIELGSSANELPKLFELARKSSSIFGGEATQNFELLTQAISSQNTRALRNLGIFIDTDKALRDYAKSQGTAVDFLSQFGKQQAILNEVLSKGEKAFEGVAINTKQTTDAFTRFKVAFTDVGEALAIVVKDVFGPLFTEWSNILGDIAQKLKVNALAKFGNDAEKTAAQIQLIKYEIETLIEKQRLMTQFTPGTDAAASKEIALAIGEQIKAKQRQIDIINLEQEEKRKDAPLNQALIAQSEILANKNIEDDNKILESKKKLGQELLRLQAENLGLLAQNAKAAGDQDQAIEIQKAQLAFQQQQQEAALKLQYQSGQIQSEYEFQAALEEIRNNFAIKEEMLELEKAQKFQAIHQAYRNGLTAIIVDSVKRIGASLIQGSKAWDSFAKSILGIIGGMAIQIGTTLLLIGTGIEKLRLSLLTLTGGPAIAAGLALIALGGLLQALSGGESAGAGTAEAGAGGGGIAGGQAGVSELTPTEEKKPQTNINIQVQGNILDRRQTGLELAEVIQETFGTQGITYKTA